MISVKDTENIEETEKFDDNLISTETLHDMQDRNQTHPKIKKEKHTWQYVIILSKRNRNVKER